MTTLLITLNENDVEVIRQKALHDGKSPEDWVAEAALQKAGTPGNKDWIEKFLESARKFTGNSHGWKWNRDELYDR